jgi:hypothetical protein
MQVIDLYVRGFPFPVIFDLHVSNPYFELAFFSGTQFGTFFPFFSFMPSCLYPFQQGSSLVDFFFVAGITIIVDTTFPYGFRIRKLASPETNLNLLNGVRELKTIRMGVHT